jgi:methoxymalonate biosynthesis protein
VTSAAAADRGPAGPVEPIKCVVWDLDNTLLDGVYLESGQQPPPGDPALLGVLRELAARGILQAVASRNPPAAADHVQRLARLSFAAAECGWDAKPDAIRRIAAVLDLPTDSMAFVDDDMVERAEVAAALPDVLVLTPEDARDAAGWPQFSPPVVTAEARRRGELYAERQRRQAAAREFAGSRAEFLRHIGTLVTIAAATAADVPRLHELSVRTHQLNSDGHPVAETDLDRLLGSAGQQVTTVRLTDDFGDDGLVGAAIMTGTAADGATGPALATVPLVMMSCRALGRGALDALLAFLCRSAAAAGAAELTVPCRVTDRNVPFRLALAAAGFRAEPGATGPDGRALFSRPLAGELPRLPDFAVAPCPP